MWICASQIPDLISAVLAEVVSQVPQLAAIADGAERVDGLLATMPFDNWELDLEQLDSLCALLTNGKLSFMGAATSAPRAGLSVSAAALLSPATKPADEASVPTGTVTRKHIEIALAPPSSRLEEQEAAEAALRVKVGCALFEKIDWSKVDNACRERALLMLLASRASVPKRWWWNQLLGAAGSTLAATPLAAETFEALMQAHSATPIAAEPISGALSAAQCKLLIAAAQQGATEGGGGGGSSLLELGMQYFLWQRLGVVMEVRVRLSTLIAASSRSPWRCC